MPKVINVVDAKKYLERNERQTAEYIGETILGLRFRVTRGAHSTEIIVLKKPNDAHFRTIDKQLELYFSFFGLGRSKPYVPVTSDGKAQDE